MYPTLEKDAAGHVACRGKDAACKVENGYLLGANLSTSLFLTAAQLRSAVCEGLRKLEQGFFQPILKFDCEHQAGNVAIDLMQLQTLCIAPKQSIEPFTMQHAIELKKTLPGLVISPLDRNIGAAFLQCHYAWSLQYKKLYMDDPHYERVQTPIADVKRELQESYHNERLHVYVPYDKKGDLNTAFMLPKNKAPTEKVRPILPNFDSPAKRITKSVAAVLGFLITCRSVLESFNMTATKELPHMLENMNKQFARLWNVSLFTFDVKNMYTELQHEDIDDALYHFLQLVRHRLKSTRFHIHKTRKKNHVFVGKNPGTRSYWSISFEVLHKVVMWELAHTYFWAGDCLLRQRIGLSMGGCCSPALAQILCIWGEHKMLSTLGADRRYIFGVRFMDDVSLAVAQGKFHLVLKVLQECYPNSCILEGDLFPANAIRMLESEIYVARNGKVVCKHINKNADAMRLQYSQAITRYTPFASATAAKVQEAAIKGVLHRMVANTSVECYMEMWGPLWTFVAELRSLGYPSHFILRILRGMQNSTFNAPSTAFSELKGVFIAFHAMFAWCHGILNSRCI
jgi:hypothetical protein